MPSTLFKFTTTFFYRGIRDCPWVLPVVRATSRAVDVSLRQCDVQIRNLSNIAELRQGMKWLNDYLLV